MDAPAPAKTAKYNRFLPYWAVFQEDVRQTLRSWVYRCWVLIWLLVAGGYLLYRGGVSLEAGHVQESSKFMAELLRWLILGTITLVVILTAGSISAERGTMADSVLSRGISRFQYFLAKWHARLITVLVTFLVLGTLALVASLFVFKADLSFFGSAVALFTVCIILATVCTCGVTCSAMTSSTVMGITVLWFGLYGLGFLLTLMPPAAFPAPDQILNRLPFMLQGYYSLQDLGHLAMWSGIFCLVVSVVGLTYFARRDV